MAPSARCQNCSQEGEGGEETRAGGAAAAASSLPHRANLPRRICPALHSSLREEEETSTLPAAVGLSPRGRVSRSGSPPARVHPGLLTQRPQRPCPPPPPFPTPRPLLGANAGRAQRGRAVTLATRGEENRVGSREGG
ncbi:unnamed protein product [Lampetra planeri]